MLSESLGRRWQFELFIGGEKNYACSALKHFCRRRRNHFAVGQKRHFKGNFSKNRGDGGYYLLF
jgi:hypothetical protein